MTTIKEAIAEQLLNIASTVKERLISTLKEEQVQKRVQQCAAVYTEWLKVQKEVEKKDKPDVKTFDASGVLVASYYSDALTKQLKTKRERLQALDQALISARDGDFKPLDKLGLNPKESGAPLKSAENDD